MVENLFVFISALIQGLNSIDYDVSAGVPDLWGPLAVPAKREDVLPGLQIQRNLDIVEHVARPVVVRNHVA